jgi:hypothetical protein
VLSVLSAGCIFWLSTLQPFFATVAIAALAYQMWLVWGRPRRRTKSVLAILWSSLALNGLIFAAWASAWFRYQ